MWQCYNGTLTPTSAITSGTHQWHPPVTPTSGTHSGTHMEDPPPMAWKGDCHWLYVTCWHRVGRGQPCVLCNPAQLPTLDVE